MKKKQLRKRIEYLEKANRQRKALDQQMLMNAAASGNRNFIAEISDLTTKYTDVNLKWCKCFREGRAGKKREEQMSARIRDLQEGLRQLAHDARDSSNLREATDSIIDMQKLAWRTLDPVLFKIGYPNG